MIVLIVAGGTGGHLYPGIAVARQLRQTKTPSGLSLEVRFLVRRGDLGKRVLEKEGFTVHEIEGQGLPRDVNLRMFSFPWRLTKGWIQAIKLLRALRPQGVLGMGGYLTFPVVLSAHILRIPCLIHEQNVIPGLANKLLSRWVDRVAVSFEEGKKIFPTQKTIVTGLPVRAEIGTVDREAGRRVFDFSGNEPVILVFGGSLGARLLNQVVCETWDQLWKKGRRFHVLHITGDRNFAEVQLLYRNSPFVFRVVPYCHRMAEAYAAADFVISRSGASTIAELEAAGKRAILIPYPYASDNHQLFNAKVLEKTGQARIIEEQSISPDLLANCLSAALDDQDAYSRSILAHPSVAAIRLARTFSELL